MPNKRKELKIEGPNLWYLVGLIATDGCLSSDRRHIDITSKDYNFIREITNLIGMENRIGIKYGFKKQKAFRIQIANRNFYEFLESTGLTQNKSLTLGRIDVPEQFFTDFLRGVIDGDGGMQRWIHPTNGREQWNLRVASGSKNFLVWLKDIVEETIGVRGKLYRESATQFRLKYGKMAAKEIIRQCYYKNCLGLDRKIKLAQECCASRVGWAHSKTVLN